MISINEYLLSKSNKTVYDGRVKATNETISKIVLDAIKNYGTGVDLNFIDTSAVTDMTSLFNQEDFEGDVSSWDVSNVTIMKYMFYKCPHFNSDLSNWDTKNVVNMANMFTGCDEFDGKCLENWNVSHVKNMEGMFKKCLNFNPDLSKWDVWDLEYAGQMFNDCVKFKGKGIDKWSTPKLEQIQEMFSGCKNFDVDMSHWFVRNVTHYSYWAYDTPIYNQREKWPKFR